MASVTVACEQAIFTSARGPTGEGYRIVAASKGLRAEEKQKITRCSPSHESLCLPLGSDTKPPQMARGDTKPPPLIRGDTGGSTLVLPAATQRQATCESASPIGAAFYPLPGDRLCIAASWHAGAEHTGRGGQRVYTHNLIVSAADFEACGSNPFNFVRAMSPSAMDIQKLPPGGVIPALELHVECASKLRLGSQCADLLPPAVRLAAIHQFLEGKPIVVDLPKEWLTWAEAMLLAMPAPLRSKVSLAAGLRFSASRKHSLYVLRDEKHAVQGRVEAQGIGFVGPRSSASPPKSHWLSFVDRHWSAGDFAGLARRTSRPYGDCTTPARERVGEWFNLIDDAPQKEITVLLDQVFRSFDAPHCGAEGDICGEFRDAAQKQLLSRFAGAAWPLLSPIWSPLVNFWKNGGNAARFAQPLLNLALGAAMRADPLMAADLALALAIARTPPEADGAAQESILKQVLERLASVDSSLPDDPAKLASLVARWRELRPKCPLVAKLSLRVMTSPAAR